MKKFKIDPITTLIITILVVITIYMLFAVNKIAKMYPVNKDRGVTMTLVYYVNDSEITAKQFLEKKIIRQFVVRHETKNLTSIDIREKADFIYFIHKNYPEHFTTFIQSTKEKDKCQN